MARRPKTWCAPERHRWQRAGQVMLHLPLADGSTHELVLRQCTRCALVEAMHVVHRGTQAALLAHEKWWEEEVAPGWWDVQVVYDKGTEG